MLAYAPRRDAPRVRPLTLCLIIIGHAAALALVLTAKQGVKFADPFTPTEIILIDPPAPPPPPDARKPTEPSKSRLTTADPIVPPPPSDGPTAPTDPSPLPPLGPTVGTGTPPPAAARPADPPHRPAVRHQ